MGGKSTKKNELQDKLSSGQYSDKNTGLDGSDKSQSQLLEDTNFTPQPPAAYSDQENENKENMQNNSNRNNTQTASPKNIPFCGVHGGNEATTVEFLHLNDPKNYKFLPAQFTE